MKRPKISNDLTVSQGQYGKFIAYADHLEQEIERLKAERVELVKWVWEEASNLRTTISIEDAESLISEYYNILKQFKKEKS